MRSRALLAVALVLLSAGAAAGQEPNSCTVDGKHASEFINVSTEEQSKGGPLAVSSEPLSVRLADPASGSAVVGRGQAGLSGGRFFSDSAASASDVSLASGRFAGSFQAWGDQQVSGIWADTCFMGNGGGSNSPDPRSPNLAGSEEPADQGNGDLGSPAPLGARNRGCGTTWIAHGESSGAGWGVYAFGTTAGGHFSSPGAEAWVGYARPGQDDGGLGILGLGSYSGGEFVDQTNYGRALVGHETFKIVGNGRVSFVQNHPTDPDRVIVYTAPEGDEVATYTRGTARLARGVARVTLGPTFALVTNPEVGLTAHLTPRGGWSELYVESLTARELVVRSRDGRSDAAFDYVVYGLRIGFEETGVVQEKTFEAYIPSMAGENARLDRHPELRQYTALERFRAMAAAAGLSPREGPGAARLLREAIQEFDPAQHANPVRDSAGPAPEPPAAPQR